MSHDTYETPLGNRYASPEMLRLFSADHKFGTWRRLWVALAESEMEMGLPVTREQVDELARAIIDHIDVVPVNKNAMKLEIKLKTGLSADFSYVRTGERYARRSAPIIKKMIDSYKNS